MKSEYYIKLPEERLSDAIMSLPYDSMHQAESEGWELGYQDFDIIGRDGKIYKTVNIDTVKEEFLIKKTGF